MKKTLKPSQAFGVSTWDESRSLCDPVPVFPGSDLDSCCSLSLWDQWKISPTVQTGFLSLSLFTFTHYVCTDASHFAPLQLGIGLISEIWIGFDFTRSPVEVLKRISPADRASAQPVSCFLRQLSEVTRSGCVHTVELIRARDQRDFKYGSSSRLFTPLLFVFKVMAERGARLLLSLFCLTITVSHAEKGKTEIKEHYNFLLRDPPCVRVKVANAWNVCKLMKVQKWVRVTNI